MAVKPDVDPKWASDNIATDNIEPTQNLKDGGIISGAVFGREHLNWMFNAFSQWIDWVRSYALDKDNNLSELTNKNTARTNLGLNSSATDISANTLGSAAKLTTARTIGGVSFDGSANINLPGVNQTGNQNTTGSAAKLTTARTISLTGDVSGSTTFDGSSNKSISVSVSNDSHNHSLNTLPNFRRGVVTVNGNSTTTLNLGNTVVTAMAQQNSLDDYDSGGIGVVWSGTNITLRNSYGNSTSIVWWAWTS